MSELLLHLIETEPPDDPVVARQIEIAQQRIRYGDRNLDLDTRHAALREALEATRRLIDEFDDHPQRPIWQTDLAEMRLTDELQVLHEHADLFYEFGVPTPEQRDVYASAVQEALEVTNDATDRLFQLRGEIGRDEQLSHEVRLSGLFSRLFEEYEAQRTPFFLAHGAYGVAQLDETPEEQRAELLDRAIEALEPFVTDPAEAPGAAGLAMVLTGRALAQQDGVSDALSMIDRALDQELGPRARLIGHLARVRATHREGEDDAALALLEELAGRGFVQDQPLFQLLVTDAEHRLRMTLAEREPAGEARAEAIAAAYQPYMRLLDAPSIERHGEALRHYVYRRWERTIADDDDLAQRPAVVRLGIAQMARIEGQQAVQRARAAGAEPPAEAIERLERAIRLGQELREQEDVDAAVRASALFNQALAQFWTAPDRLGNHVTAGELFTDLAANFPESGRSGAAIANAVGLLRPVHQMDNAPEEVRDAYVRAAEVLFEHYGNTPTADDHRLYYAFSVLHRGGRYAEAARMYAQVPRHHRDYFEARRERLYALRELYRQSEDDARDAAAERVVEAAEELAERAEAAMTGGEGTERARRAAAGARLMLSHMAAETGDTDRALALLGEFDDLFADEPDLVREALEQRILVLIDAGQQAQQQARETAATVDRQAHVERAEQLMARAVDEAQRMSEQFPDDAAAVIDEVLNVLEQRIEGKRMEAVDAVQRDAEHLRQAADQMASVAAELARTLVAWAQGQGFDRDAMLPFRLIEAKSHRLAGDPAQAASLLEPWLEEFADDAELISEYADALFDQGGEENLLRAARYYDRLITGLQEPYPSTWWNAWTRRLQINDALGRGTQSIPLRVRQLRMTDSELGGQPYRRTLEQLEARHAR